jgi:hypothetical protein
MRPLQGISFLLEFVGIFMEHLQVINIKIYPMGFIVSLDANLDCEHYH